MSSSKRKANSDEGDGYPPLPRRRYTAYNIFSQLERHYILQTRGNAATADLPTEVDPNAAQRPEKYRNIVLPKNWYVVGANRKKRQHHVNHGVISFVELTKTISQSWNTCDFATRMYCKGLADEEMDRYNAEIKAYEDKYGEEVVKAQRKKELDKKRRSKSKAKANITNDDVESGDEHDDEDTNSQGHTYLRYHQPPTRYAPAFPESDFPDRVGGGGMKVAASNQCQSSLLHHHQQMNHALPFPPSDFPDRDDEDLKPASVETTALRRYDHSLGSIPDPRGHKASPAVASRHLSSMNAYNVPTGEEVTKVFDDDDDEQDVWDTSTTRESQTKSTSSSFASSSKMNETSDDRKREFSEL
eukprot:g11548.t1 g11548   contig6:59274-60347(-)